MNELSIGAVARAYEISTRTLRYYDQIGLLGSKKADNGLYRVYDGQSLRRLRQILVLRRLSIPLQRVAEMLDAPDPGHAAALLRDNIRETETDLGNTLALRNAQQALLRVLEQGSQSVPLLLDQAAAQLLPSLCRPIQEKENLTMSELKLEMTNTQRTVFLPPMTVATSRAFASEPEGPAFEQIAAFIRETRLWERKPDLRIFGFNNPSIPNEKGEYGYEYWVTLPDGVEPTAPLGKRVFCGGLYVAHCIKMGDFHEWRPFQEWASHNDSFECEAREPEGMWGGLEEHLNAYEYFAAGKNGFFPQLDLLIPVHRK